MTKRIASIDIAKGIGIILVVIGHNRVIKEIEPLVYAGIYLFHMPLFFFLSGALTKTPFDIVKLESKSKALVRPYLTGIILFLPLQLLQKDHPSNSPLLGNIVWGSGNSIYNTPLWFLTCLISGYGCFWLLDKMGATKKPTIAILSALSGITLIYFALSLQYGYEHLPKDKLDRPLGAPLNLDLAMLCAGFLLLGSEFSRLIKNPPRSRLLALCAAASGAILIYILIYYDPRLDLNYRLIQNWQGTLACSLVGIIAVISISMLIDRHSPLLSHPLEYFGKNTLVILVLHAPIQNYLLRFSARHFEINFSAAILASILLCLIFSWVSENIVLQHPHLRKLFYER